ncbi:TORTIFOLIA1-like protein 2 isoform X2 [Asparagus officinalis]|uniref:TORTIFOLIA1-like protein 2 isoform X2 n=1 Tax=Asparagus officinalis TaxID=4686 RepID=UPI00098E68C9|nr:TORTIFOLIA1-like protein 2 isoform X2 [Asparagus officinalis]
MRPRPHPAIFSSKPKQLSAQQAVFDLKQRVLLSLNKLSDRDTHQIAADELEKIARGLAPEGVAPFLACITDTGSEQKSAVRKECVRLTGTLARFHGPLLAPHLGKILASIVRRLKDSDSVVRDACVETAGVLAATVMSSRSSAQGAESAFVAILKPLFEALGEQSRYVQAGSASCLARVIDDTSDPPTSVFPQMLARVIRLLKNPHFMAKPAAIDLIRSIVQAGGASTEHVLSTVVTSILETLKSADWTTRKAASVALASIAVHVGPSLGSCRTSCILSLESCRFDKVKPVRDTIMHALQCWKTVPGTGSHDPSEAGSSTKENGDYSDVTSASDGGWRDLSCGKVGPVSALSATSTLTSKKRNPLTVQKACSNYVHNSHHPSSSDWHIDISLPKVRAMSTVGDHLKEFEGYSTEMTLERAADANKLHDNKYDYAPADDNIDCSSTSDLVSGSFETKHVTVSESPATLNRLDRRSVVEDADSEDPRMQERKSLDSTVTDLSSAGMQGCCLHTASELAFIKKQLLEIETKQSNLLDLLQVFMGNSVDNLSSLQLKVHNLEHVVVKIGKSISQNGNYSNMANSRLTKQNQSVCSSPRLSTSTPRQSVESNYRQPSLSSLSNKEVWGVDASSKNRLSTSVKDGMERWRDPTLNIVRNNALHKESGRSAQNQASSQTRGTKDMLSVSDCSASTKLGKMEGMSGFWKHIKEFLHSGDMESAYAETLCIGDDLCLIELMDKTGPVLERLSCETASAVISILTKHFLNQRFIDFVIPWFLQVVNLSGACEPGHLVMSSKTRMEFLYALQQAACLDSIDQVDRTAITKCAAKLSQLWGEALSRYLHTI